jgi:hypothetical protein
MPEKAITENECLIPAQPVPECAQEFSQRVHGLMDGQPKDEATVARALDGMDAVVDMIAAGLYNLASMLVGEGEESIRLVETAIATAELSACRDPKQARKGSRWALCAAALKVLAHRDPESLAAPGSVEAAGGCIEDDDLDAAAASGEELLTMLAGPDRERARNWLAGLPTLTRTIFVLRAVAGFSAAETAALLAANGGPRAAGWSTAAVRAFSRQGLCSLAAQLLHASSR